MTKILVTGALGQIGSELTTKLIEVYGKDNVIATDIKNPKDNHLDVTYRKLDVTDIETWSDLIKSNEITEVYHLAAMLSATAAKYPLKGWELNTAPLLGLLNMANDLGIEKIFWPSSIAVYGRDAVKDFTPQGSRKNPQSLYGIAKVSGEGFCELYNKEYDVDVRSIRYPGLISWKTLPGGGTTDYAVDIYYKALEEGYYSCFLSEDTELPMMYMDDAVRATIELMQAPKENISVHSAYNIHGTAFTPKQIAQEIKKHISNFEIEYNPDYRQRIADSWPHSINDDVANRDWGWKAEYDLEKMTKVMLEKLSDKLKKPYK
ncbi:NAD-dependent epimerase/dehydratase family protein [Flavobacteriaceae bacterium Ap0902]|nr:NAD-dependent epimerase/dehydratase family protein [Flavobacteriaceae bacterium Ap0902]